MALRYALVNHIPLAAGSRPGTVRIGDLWLADLRAQARSLESVARLVLVSPLTDAIAEEESGSFHLVEIRPEEEGFEHVPLPFFCSMGSFLKLRGAVRRRLGEALRGAAIAHMGIGGHPIPYGQLAWPIAGQLGAKRILVFDGSDEFPRRERIAAAERNPVKRFARRKVDSALKRFCRRAIRDADLVFSHNESIVKRFEDVWGSHCHLFERTFVTDDLLISDEALRLRQEELRDRSIPLRLACSQRQIAIKATDHVLRAMEIARRQGVETRLDVFGEGEDLPRYRRLAEELGLEDAVTFHGGLSYGPDLFEKWRSSHVTMITNITAEISRSVTLSLAMGLPIIGYRNPGHDALLERADAAILVPTGDIEALAQAIIDADADREKLARFAENGARLASSWTLAGVHRRRAELAGGLLAAG